MGVLAGVEGFEPSHGGIKTRCLTTWLRPKRPRVTRAIVSRDPGECQTTAADYRKVQSSMTSRTRMSPDSAVSRAGIGCPPPSP